MSWPQPQWPGGAAPQPAIPSLLSAATPVVNPAPAVAPPGLQYTPEQWAQLQQQNWNQWAQWQQQYQQWHQQYGAEYQKSINALNAQSAQPPMTALPNVGLPPPLPIEVKPPLPLDDPPPTHAYTTAPPNYTNAPPPKPQPPPQPPKNNQNWHNQRYDNNNKRTYEQSDRDSKRPMVKPPWQNQRPQQRDPIDDRPPANKPFWPNRPPNEPVEVRPPITKPVWQPPPQKKGNIEELSEAEKKFDKQFAEWEAQYNRWKEQNVEHPDKEQYREYEKKWETWRAQLLDRREQMKRKRLGLTSDSPNRGRPPNFNQSAHKIDSPNLGGGLLPTPGLPSSIPPPNLNDEPLKFRDTKPFPDAKPFPEEGSDFLKTLSTGGIPGLDLVKDDPKPENEDVILVDGNASQREKPDFDAISKGINNILGDQKLLNMLSMVTQNQNLANIDKVVSTTSRIGDASNPDHFQSGFNEQSNPSHEEFSNQSDSYNQREFVNNFDDQTRSSFTMAHSEPDFRFDRGGNQRFDQNNQFPNRFGNVDSKADGEELNNSNFGRNNPNFDSRFGGRGDQFGGRGNRQFGMEGELDHEQGFGGRGTNRRFGSGGEINPDKAFGGRGDNRQFGPGDDIDQEKSFGGKGNNRRFGPGNDQDKNKIFGGRGDNKQFGPGSDVNLDNPFEGRGDNRQFGPLGGPPQNSSFGARGDNRQFGSGGAQSQNNSFGGDNRQSGSRGDMFQDKPFGGRGDNRKFGPRGDLNQDPPFGKFGPGSDQDKSFGRGDNRQGGPGGETNQTKPFGGRGNFGSGSAMNQDKQLGGRGVNRQGSLNQDKPFDGGRAGSRFEGNFGRSNSQDKFRPPNGANKQFCPTSSRQVDSFDDDYDYNQYGDDYNQDHFESTGSFDNRNNNSSYDQDDYYEDNFDYDENEDPFADHEDENAPFEDAPFENAPEPEYHEDPWIEDESYNQDPFEDAPEVKEEVAPDEPEEILKPTTVIDYDHKSLKSVEPEVLLEPLRMFDYRHKPLSRIPFPQRPQWLSESVRNIREFDPLIVRSYEPPNLRRYPPIEAWRGDRYPEDRWSPHNRRGYTDTRPPFDERRSYGETRPYEGRNPPAYESREETKSTYDNKFEERPSYERKSSYEEPKFKDESRKWEDKNFSGSNEDRGKSFEPPKEDNFKSKEQQFREEKPSWKKETERSDKLSSNKIFETSPVFNKAENKIVPNRNVVLIEDIINPPGRYNRAPRIVIILRGPPGSGKTFLAKLIKDREVENGGSTPRILSLDDYFMVEQEKEIVEEGRRVKIKEMVYEYEAEMEESYRSSLIKSFKKTITDGYFSFIIVDNVNDKVKYFGEMWSFAKQNGFQVYICQLDLDVQICSKRNIHGRTEADIEMCVSNWEPTPSHHPILDATSLIQSGSISEVEMEEVNSPESNTCDNDGSEDQVTRSKWDNFDCSVDNLAKLDGVSKPLRHGSRTMEEYLQLDNDEWTPARSTKPGQKRVRWADLEEQKQQEKMRAIGFVVGQTNWERMMDPTMGGSALTQTKYIERTGRF